MSEIELEFEALGSHRDYGDLRSFQSIISKAYQKAKARNKPISIVNISVDEATKFEIRISFANENEFEIEIFERLLDQSKELEFFGKLRKL